MSSNGVRWGLAAGIAAVAVLIFGCGAELRRPQGGPGSVKHYLCVRAVDQIRVDGVLDEFSWMNARRVGEFERIISPYPEIRYHTEAAMVWDAENLYIAFSCADPEMWTTFSNEDDPLWGEEVVEAFIDPDGDGRNYLELEVNPLNAVVDLKIFQPRPTFESDIEWDIPGLQTAVRVHGTVNDSTDTDIGWDVEIAIPWAAFKEITPEAARPPEEGEQWRLNLYRIERVGGRSGKARIDALSEQAKKAQEEEDHETLAKLKKRIEALQLRTEYTCWSPTYKQGFHDPDRFGVVEFR